MLSQDENKLLCSTGPGTPMGDLFRRFWLPVVLSLELPEPVGAPVRLRILSEDLIAFRDSHGRVGLTARYCLHRGVSLEHLGTSDAGAIARRRPLLQAVLALRAGREPVELHRREAYRVHPIAELARRVISFRDMVHSTVAKNSESLAVA